MGRVAEGREGFNLFAFGLHNCLSDFHQYMIDLIHHILIPKTQDPNPLFIQVNRPLRVVFYLFRMLKSVYFDDQPGLRCVEINNIRANGMLPPEGCISHLLSPQPYPQLQLRRRHFFPQLSGTEQHLRG